MVQIPKRLAEQVDLEATLVLILRNAIEALGGSAGVVATWSEAEHRFIVSAYRGLDAKTLAQLRPLLNECIPDLTMSRESFSRLSELRPESTLPSSENGTRQDPIISFPLQIGSKTMGLIYVLRPLGAVTFSKPDQRILAAFAEQAAIALQNTRLARLLAEEKQRVESILEGSADGIMSIDAQRRLVGFNAAMERLTGYSREEVLGKECLKILNLRDATGKILCNRQCPMLMSSMKGNFIFEQQGAIRTKAGKDVEVAMTYAIVTSTEGKPVNAVVNVRDISRLKELEDLRETFLTMLGHELQTPLSIIKGYANTLSRSDGRWNKETLHQGLSVIEEESDRLSKVVDRLLLASRISTGALTLEKEPTQLPPLVSKVVRRFQTVTNIHTFEVDFEPDFPSILADPGLIEEVLVNLAENAVKYSPEGGRIIISGRHDNKQVTITVTDEGIGIAPEDMERIFERFGRAETGRARNIKGMGLGLHICKSIIQAHVGTIEAVSKPGKGSQFIFTLPLE